MSSFREKFLSVENEIAVHPELPHERSATEPDPKPAEDKADYYHSAAFEPGSPIARQKYRELMEAENARYSSTAVVTITIAGGILGGIFAVPAIFLHGSESWIRIFMMVVFGPFAEETLKQSGMIFQLEKLPGSVRNNWQFFLSGALGGLVFGILENLLYQYVYLTKLPPEKLVAVMSFRWIVCTLLHISCTQISALGLRRVWRESRTAGMPVQISQAFPWFVTAMGVHGCYNLVALLWFERFLS
ncbi:MAG: PrsW family intramembrane metalloprotease [Lentisphaeria bacterium]|nr:PrsW family intramembrane metalloprotease [Lentisphaeria bacterium]